MDRVRVLFSCCIFCVSVAWNVTATCVDLKGNMVRVGSAWVAKDSCNVCTCTEYGVECGTWQSCDQTNLLGTPGDVLCRYASATYLVGQNWTTEDGCNQCRCENVGMICTAHPCVNTGFDQPKAQGENAFQDFMDCRYGDRIYAYGDHFLADDGCNTCMCIMPGNYASFPACTSTPCDLIG